jgi:eukaryotic-like serine/threonine-protein kinase
MFETRPEAGRILKSSLVTDDELRAAVAKVTFDFGTITEKLLLDELMKKGLVSRWQAEQIGEGRTQGFFVQQFKILSLSVNSASSFIAEAENINTNKRAILKVTRTGPGKLFVEQITNL